MWFYFFSSNRNFSGTSTAAQIQSYVDRVHISPIILLEYTKKHYHFVKLIYLSYIQIGIVFCCFHYINGKIKFRSASSQHRILLPDGSLFFLRAVRGEDDGTYYCVAFANNNNKAASVVKSQNATLRVACKLKKSFFLFWMDSFYNNSNNSNNNNNNNNRESVNKKSTTAAKALYC